MKHGIDLHIHSTYSDGTCTPEEIVALAKENSLTAIALTDHDSVGGIAITRTLCEENNIHFIPGIELSADDNGKEIHILGYFIDEKDQTFLSYLEQYIDSRLHRNEQMIDALKEYGFNITLQDVLFMFPDRVITRAHIARYLYNTGQIKSMDEAFAKYIGDGACCYVQRTKVSAVDAIKLIHDAGGIAVLAHPTLYNLSRKDTEALVRRLSEHHLDGIEAVYTTYHNDQEAEMKRLAQTYHLVITGGSDFHGTNKPYIHLGTGRGNLYIHDSIYEKLLTYMSSISPKRSG